jgi:hypothetical protein
MWDEINASLHIIQDSLFFCIISPKPGFNQFTYLRERDSLVDKTTPPLLLLSLLLAKLFSFKN